MIYDTKWSIGENFTVINEDQKYEDSFDINQTNFDNLIRKIKSLSEFKNQDIKNCILLLEDYRDSLNYISNKCKVGALTDVENLVNKKLDK